MDQKLNMNMENNGMMEVKEYGVSTNAYAEWKAQQGKVAHIRLVGYATDEQIYAFAELFDYKEYKTITLGTLKLDETVYSDGYRSVYESRMQFWIEGGGFELPPLIKMIMNRDNDSLFRVTKEGNIFTSDMRTLIHMQQVPETLVLEGIERIGNVAFCGADRIKHITFSQELRYIGEYAFNSVDNLDVLELPDSVTELGIGAFYGYHHLKSLRLPRHLRVIPDKCFNGNELEHLEIPSSVREIGSEAFGIFPSYKVSIPEGVERIGYYSFPYVKLIDLPASLKEIAPDFYYDDPVDVSAKPHPPYVRISADNPIFYAKGGSRYFRENDKLALASCYNGPCKWNS